jgi:hypothetical protein
MFFVLLLGLSALAVTSCAAYFSVMGIATLFSGSFYQAMVMATCLEFGKIIATSYLYRYWNVTNGWLKTYLIVAVIVLMGITSLGVFGYLTAAYQVNLAKFGHQDSNIALLEEQKTNIDTEINQNINRIQTLNQSRLNQEQRLPNLSRQAAAPIYADIERASKEIQSLNNRNQELYQSKTEKDNSLLQIKSEISKSKDIGTFKFVAEFINLPLNTVVTIFIFVLICVFDPLAVALILAYNVVKYNRLSQKNTNSVTSTENESQEFVDTATSNETEASSNEPVRRKYRITADGKVKNS